MLSVVTSIETVSSEVPQSLPTHVSTYHPEEEDAPFDQNVVVKSSSINTRKSN